MKLTPEELAQAFRLMVSRHEPERPRIAWTCPACGRLRDALEFYCDHAGLVVTDEVPEV